MKLLFKKKIFLSLVLINFLSYCSFEEYTDEELYGIQYPYLVNMLNKFERGAEEIKKKIMEISEQKKEELKKIESEKKLLEETQQTAATPKTISNPISEKSDNKILAIEKLNNPKEFLLNNKIIFFLISASLSLFFGYKIVKYLSKKSIR